MTTSSLKHTLIHSFGSKIFGAWNLLILTVVTFSTVSIPFSIAVSESSQVFLVREIILTALYVADILLSLFRLKRKVSSMHIEHSAMKSFYQRWIIVEVVAALPLALLFGLPWLQLLRLTKLVKVIYIIQIFRRVKAQSSNYLLMLQIIYWAAMATHWLSCGWLSLRGLDHDVDLYTNYIDALYWTTSTLTTVGYGDITPITTTERLYTIITMIFGFSFLGYLVGSVAGILAKKDPIQEKFNENLEKLTNAARYANLPLDLQRRIYSYFRYQMIRRVGYDEESFIEELPSSMRGEVSLYFRKEVIENISLFQDAHQDFIMEIGQHLRERIVAPEEYIFKSGDLGKEMFLIAHGSVGILNSDETVHFRTLENGDFFGEIALFKDIPRTATARAETYCDLYILSQDAFEIVFQKYPKIADQIRSKAQERAGNQLG